MTMNRILLLAGFIVLVACQIKNQLDSTLSHQAESQELIRYLHYIPEYPLQGETYQGYRDRIHQTVSIPLQKTDSPNLLKSYFYECEKVKNETGYAGIKLEEGFPLLLYQTQENILFRLAEIKTEAAAKVLVDIYADDEFHFDAGYALSLGEAMVQCGEIIVPLLEEKKSLRPVISGRVLECIQKGKSFL